MLTIARAQYLKIEDSSRREFANELVAHCAVFAPRLYELRGHAPTHRLCLAGLERATGYGFTLRGPVRFFVELMLTLGWRFDTDPQLPWAQEILSNRNEPELERAQRLHDAMTRYLESVDGPNKAHAIAALRRVAAENWPELIAGASGGWRSVLALMQRLHPFKFEHVGAENLQRTFALAREVGVRHELASPGGMVMLSSLMFGFGSGICDDPMYPWVSVTLARTELGVEQRVDQLQSKTRIYADSVLAHLST